MSAVDKAPPLVSRAKDVVFHARGGSSSPNKSPDARSRRSQANGKGVSGRSPASSSSHDGSSRPSSRAAGSGFLVDDHLPYQPPVMKDGPVRSAAFPRISGESARLGSPLSRELPVDQMEEPSLGYHAAAPRLDPAQLVQMALELSESRRRHSGRVLQPHASIHHDPDLASKYGSVRSKHNTSRSSPSPHYDGHPAGPPSADDNSPQPAGAALDASPATIARAERARRYFELAAAHRRALECLPSGANRAHQLGRQYNPLKALRNRRERTTTVPADAWLDVDVVTAWVDDLQVATGSLEKSQRFDMGDHPFQGGNGLPFAAAKGHQRSDTANSVLVKHDNFWSVEPAERLDDLYWSELKSSKRDAAARHGREHHQHESASLPNIERERVSEDSKQDLSDTADSDANDTQGEGRLTQRKHLLSRRRRKARNSSIGTASSVEGSKPRENGADVNVGPLERHMREIMSKNEHNSPDLESPDHWGFPNSDSRDPRPQPLRLTSASGRPRAVTVTSTTSNDVPASPPDLPRNATVVSRPKSKLHRLPIFRSKDSALDQVDGADGQLSRHSLDLPRPGLGRHRTTESWSGSPKRNDEPFASPDGRDATSSMQRLLKGGRLGEYVRNEGARLRSKKQTESTAKVDTEDQSSSENNDNVETIDFGTGNEKQKYYLPDLPTFKSRKRVSERERDSVGIELAESSTELPALSTIESQRHWSISDRVTSSASSGVTAKEVARIRALLLASGVKASELIGEQQKNERYDEDGQRFSAETDEALSLTQRYLQSQRQVAQSLNERTEGLLERASTLLTQDATEQADQFTAELVSKAPQDVRRLDDAINTILRRRRRQFRLFRQTGFKLLEIFLLFLFRFLWLIFMLFTSIRRIVVTAFKIVRWLFVI